MNHGIQVTRVLATAPDAAPTEQCSSGEVLKALADIIADPSVNLRLGLMVKDRTLLALQIFYGPGDNTMVIKASREDIRPIYQYLALAAAYYAQMVPDDSWNAIARGESLYPLTLVSQAKSFFEANRNDRSLFATVALIVVATGEWHEQAHALKQKRFGLGDVWSAVCEHLDGGTRLHESIPALLASTA
jgi:hypothetical protein